MTVLTPLIAVIAVVCLVHGLLTLRYALSVEWMLYQRLNGYL
jgi:hypothetical protein